ncbi:MAG TPA: hypothetical protein VM099_05845 [Gemmatimonadaceae bacterium]|nr:hypothetical protein [Gemmatimonadaceae bacterium]
MSLVGALAFSLASCDTDKVVKVEDPAQLQPGATANAATVPFLVNGAFRQFVGGYSGLGDDAFVSMGVLTDEFYWGDSFTTRFAADRRTLQPTSSGNISDTPFSRLMQSRMLARRAYAAVGQFESDLDDPTDFRSELRTIEGYVYVTLSEGWCGAVPFSSVPDAGDIDPKAIEYGDPLSTNAMNQQAVTLFNEAISLDGRRLAMVGKGRALLNQGQYAAAAAAVASVPTTYVFLIEHSTNTSTENNGIASLFDNGRYGISNLEGGLNSAGNALRPDNNASVTNAAAEGLNFRTANDPRLPYVANGGCFTGSIQCWINNNMPDISSDLPLASGVEARLIEAEAALQAGDAATMITKLNGLRAQVAALLPLMWPSQKQVFPVPTSGAPVLPALTDPGTAAGRRDLLFRERAFWLYSTGHRLGDMRRLIRQYSLPQTSVFPTGPYFRGGSFGTDVNYPVPFNEDVNNPKFHPEACVTTQA